MSKRTIKRAYEFSKEKHKGYERINGEYYFKHPENMYKILLKKRADDVTLCGALLHDLIEDAGIDLKDIQEKFGKKIAFIVDGMTKIKGLGNYLKKFKKYAKKDRRILLVKLADLEENLSVLKHVKEEERERVKEKYERFIDLIKKLVKTKEEENWVIDIEKRFKKNFKDYFFTKAKLE